MASLLDAASKPQLNGAWLRVNGKRVVKVDKITTFPRTGPSYSQVIVAINGVEYTMPPDAVINSNVLKGYSDNYEVDIDITLDMEKAFDYSFDGILPKEVGDAFEAVVSNVPTSPWQNTAPITLSDLQTAAAQTGAIPTIPTEITLTPAQAVAFGVISQELYDEWYPPLTSPTVSGFTSSEATYGFGILSEEQSAEVAKNVKASLQGWPNEPSAVALFDRKAQLEQALAAKREELKMALAVSLLDVTLEPIALREV